jgi:hypothetical protein
VVLAPSTLPDNTWMFLYITVRWQLELNSRKRTTNMLDYSDTTFSVNEDIIEGIAHLIGQQENIIVSDIGSVLQQVKGQVQEGIWRGERANTFSRDLETNLIPLFIQLNNLLMDMEQGTRRLLDVIADAEFQVANAVEAQIQVRKMV